MSKTNGMWGDMQVLEGVTSNDDFVPSRRRNEMKLDIQFVPFSLFTTIVLFVKAGLCYQFYVEV